MLAVDKAGMDESYRGGSKPARRRPSGTIDKSNPTDGFGNTPTSVSTDGRYDRAMEDGTDIGASSEGIDSGEGIDIGTPAKGNDGSSGGASQDEGGIRLSREGTTARRVGDSSTFRARTVSKVGRTAYLAAGNRLMGQKSIVRGGRYVTKNTRAQNLSNMHAGIQDLIHPKRIDELSSTHAEKRDMQDMREMEDFERS